MSTLHLTSFTLDLALSLAYQPKDMQLLTSAVAEAYDVPEALVHVRKTPPDVDRQGIDYVVRVLSSTAPDVITVDMKRTAPGKAKYWRSPDDPNAIIETWSVAPSETGSLRNEEAKPQWQGGVPGALFRNGPLPDYWALAYGDLPDTVYLLPAEQLRQAAQRHRAEWERTYGVYNPPRTQWGAGQASYASSFVPVPLSVVMRSLDEVS